MHSTWCSAEPQIGEQLFNIPPLNIFPRQITGHTFLHANVLILCGASRVSQFSPVFVWSKCLLHSAQH